MPQSADLMGFSMPFDLAGELGNNPQAVAGSGTTQTGTPGAILSHMAEVTGTSSNTAAILPVGKIGTPYYIASVGGTAAKIYVPSGHSLNGTSNGAATFSGTGLLIFIQTSLKKWWVTGTATSSIGA